MFFILIKRRNERIILAIGVSKSVNTPKKKKAALFNETISINNCFIEIVLTYSLDTILSEWLGSSISKTTPINKKRDDSKTPVFNNLLIAFSIIFPQLIRYKSSDKIKTIKLL